jgi:ParB family chromosome partitioning protein
VRQLPIDSIEANPRQPRTEFDEEQIADLSRSISERGLLQPILVRSLGEGRYELIAGERRMRASKRAGLTEIPALVRDASDDESLVMAIVENVQRTDLGALEEARAYQMLIDEFELTQEEVARRVGKTRVTVANSLRLLQLPEEVRTQIANGRLTAGHARALLALEGDQARTILAREAVQRGFTVRDVEKAAKRSRASDPGPSGAPDPDVARIESDLSRALGTKVRIQSGAKGAGRLEIHFYSGDDFTRLVDRLLGTNSPLGGRARSATA